ncbi:hypothetical protein [Okeania sp.]|nr:hypothetical protein [Okeania sp.]
MCALNVYRRIIAMYEDGEVHLTPTVVQPSFAVTTTEGCVTKITK